LHRLRQVFSVAIMTVSTSVAYVGGLNCEVTHGPSGTTFRTDAPTDNQGKGAYISPTDLAGASMASCMMTIMAIQAESLGLDLTGSHIEVTKAMHTGPERRIRELAVTFNLRGVTEEKHRLQLQRAAKTCPVHRSFHPDVSIPLTWNFESA
jgi:putative redox protein